MSNYLAGKMAQKQAEGMLSPLLDDDEEDDDTDASSLPTSDGDDEEKVKRTPMERLKSTLVYGGLCGGVGLSAAAIVFAPAPAVIAMGAVCVLNAPYATFKEKKIAAIPSLRSMNNRLKDEADRLGEAVDQLAEEIDLLGPEADRAAEVEEELRSIADAQEVNVSKLVDLVKENAIILAKMRDNLRQRIVQDIIAIVVASDRDNDQTISQREGVTLALRIRIALQEYGVLFDSDKFLRAIGGDTTVAAVIAIVQKLLPRERRNADDDSDSEDSLEDHDMYDMFHMMEEGSLEDGSSTTANGPARGVSLMTCDRKKSSVSRSVQLLEAKRAPLYEGSDSEDSEEEVDY